MISKVFWRGYMLLLVVIVIKIIMNWSGV